ncbi:hypothetical protein PCAU_5525 [Pseudomonas chlororaphis subsp. aurantiaca]|nr:hypothetical protein PCAU_5525 [Pseudomonas chlororaphis subsp. aurantiaca]
MLVSSLGRLVRRDVHRWQEARSDVVKRIVSVAWAALTVKHQALSANAISPAEGRAWQKLAANVCVLVQTYGAALFALNFLGVTLNSSSCFALTLGSRLLVKFAATNFSQNTGFFAGALETTQSYVEGFVLFNFDGWHPELPSFITGVNVLVAKIAAEVVGF